LVPAYLALMVLIFVMPQRGHQPASVQKPVEDSIDGILTELTDRPDEVGRHQHASELLEGKMVNAPTSESVRLNPDLANTGRSRPRRGPGRARKAAKAATESAPDSPSVTWIRVGPGKFVRADTSVTATEQLQTEDMTTSADPAADVRVEMLAALSAPTDAQAERALPCPQEATPVGGEIVVSPNDGVQESMTEEYGIAPSTLGPVPLTTRSIEGLEHGESEVAIDHEAVLNHLTADLCTNVSRHDESWERAGFHGGPSKSRVGRSRKIATAISSVNRPYLRRNIRQGLKSRTPSWSSIRSNARLRQVACRAFGRIFHIQRALRPRSPP
jgi:hypothetical protein